MEGAGERSGLMGRIGLLRGFGGGGPRSGRRFWRIGYVTYPGCLGFYLVWDGVNADCWVIG